MARSAKANETTKRPKRDPRPLDEKSIAQGLGEIEERDKVACLRTRRFSMVSYLPTVELDRWLRGQSWIQHWAYCYHDKDVENGKPKPPHTHVLVCTYDAKTVSAMRKRFGRLAVEVAKDGEQPQNTLGSVMSSPCGAWRYLIHADDPDKFQYPVGDRVGDDYVYWNNTDTYFDSTDTTVNHGLAMVEDVLSGTSTMELVRRYGKEYIYHSRQIRDIVKDVISESFNSQGTNQFTYLCDIYKMCLDCSPFKQEDITTFFNLLYYIESCKSTVLQDYKFNVEVLPLNKEWDEHWQKERNALCEDLIRRNNNVHNNCLQEE